MQFQIHVGEWLLEAKFQFSFGVLWWQIQIENTKKIDYYTHTDIHICVIKADGQACWSEAEAEVFFLFLSQPWFLLQCDMQKLTVDELKRLLYDTFRDHLTMKDIEHIIMTEENHLNSPESHVDIDSTFGWKAFSWLHVKALLRPHRCANVFVCLSLHSEPHAAGKAHVCA